MRKKLLLLLVCCMTAVCGFAQSGTCGTNLTWTLSGGTLTISGTGNMYDYWWSGNTSPWNSYQNNIATVIIGANVTSIGVYAFYKCSHITSVTISNSVTSIGDCAFQYCSGLTSVTIPNSVTNIGGEAFESCIGLTSVTISNSVTSMGGYVFEDTPWFNNQSDGVVYIGKVLYCYKGTMPANTIIDVEAGTICISASAFDSCSGLTSITIPNSVTSIGYQAFYNCSNLTSVTIPNSVTSIGNSTFDSCSGLTSVTIPNSVTSIGDCAFQNCHGLTSITIPNSVTNIGVQAFYNCSGLAYITIPNSITSIGTFAFEGTSWLNNQSDGVVYIGKVLYCYKGTMPANTIIEVEAGTMCILNRAFSDCHGLTSITIPNSVTNIGDQAFYNCSGLTSITIPNSVTSVSFPFTGCINLSSLTLPIKIKIAGDSVLGSLFSRSSSSSPITGYNQQGYFGSYYYYVPSSLKTITITDSVDIKDNFFQNTNLETIYMPLVKSIGANAFSGCPLKEVITPIVKTGLDLFPASLQKLTVTPACTSIPAGILSACNNLQELTLPFIGTSPDATGESAILGALFGSSSSSTAVTQYYDATNSGKYAIPLTLTKLIVTRPAAQIRYGALYNCTMLKEVTFGSSVQGLAEKALFGCNGLTDIYSQWAYPPTALDNNTFEGVNKFACTLHVPTGSKQYYSVAAGWKEFYSPVDNIQEEAPLVITAQAVPLYGGEISGAKQYNYEDDASLTAHGNMGYNFKAWMEDNAVVSTEPTYNFTVTAPRSLYAVFTPIENADENIQIQAQAHSASVSWIAVEDAANYTLVIYSDESRKDIIATFQLDANGNVLRNTARDLSCTIPDLNLATTYYYSLTSYDANNNALTISNGNFSTTTSTGIDNVSAGNQLRIYPNPVSESFRISGIAEPTVVTLTDITGKIVLQQTVNPDEIVTVGHLQKGVYFVSVKGKTMKMIRQ